LVLYWRLTGTGYLAGPTLACPCRAMDAKRSAHSPDREQEKQELAALLSHPDIARSTNMVRMLRFICEKYFEGRIEDIRESNIAVHALGRNGSTFDSHADPIVRVTARTLRKRLDAFYRTEGRHRTLKLELPVGRYVPQFVPIESGAHSTEIPASEKLSTNSRPPDRVLLALALATTIAVSCTASFWIGYQTATASVEQRLQACLSERRLSGPTDAPLKPGAHSARTDHETILMECSSP
jgi:hypothetical protein